MTKGTAWGEKVHRGHLYGIRQIDAGNKTDWFLVPKDEENQYVLNIAPYLNMIINKFGPSHLLPGPSYDPGVGNFLSSKGYLNIYKIIC